VDSKASSSSRLVPHQSLKHEPGWDRQLTAYEAAKGR
jgi:hypothetical protein